jgi:hypothetical protein
LSASFIGWHLCRIQGFMKLKSTKPLISIIRSLPNAADVMSRYIGKVAVANYRGIHRFYRAAGFNAKGKATNNFFGEWWADETFLLELGRQLESSTDRSWQSGIDPALPFHFQALILISHDWDDTCEIFVLEIPPGYELEGLCGIARHQPEYSVNDPFKPYDPERIYIDRPEQVYFTARNPHWVHKVNMWQF